MHWEYPVQFYPIPQTALNPVQVARVLAAADPGFVVRSHVAIEKNFRALLPNTRPGRAMPVNNPGVITGLIIRDTPFPGSYSGELEEMYERGGKILTICVEELHL